MSLRFEALFLLRANAAQRAMRNIFLSMDVLSEIKLLRAAFWKAFVLFCRTAFIRLLFYFWIFRSKKLMLMFIPRKPRSVFAAPKPSKKQSRKPSGRLWQMRELFNKKSSLRRRKR